MQTFRMCLNLNEYQFKISKYIYRLTYMSFTVTTNQKSTIKKKEQKERERYPNIILKKITKPQGRKLKEEINRTTKITRKQQKGNKYIPINNHFKF